MSCEHKDCGNIDKVWLPYQVRENNRGLKSHPYCVKCGFVKNISSDKSKNIGYYINVLSFMEKHLKIPGASVRNRLIVKELENIEDFEDEYSMNRYNQEKLFINIVKKHFQLNDAVIQSFL